MDKRERYQKFFRYIIFIIGILIIVFQLKDANIKNANNILESLIFLTPCILMSIMTISIGKEGDIDLSDTLMTFIYAIYGITEGVIFAGLAWGLASIINEKFITKRNNAERVIFNSGMFVIATYITSLIIDYIKAMYDWSRLLIYVIASIGFIGIFLLINIRIMKIDFYIEKGKSLNFEKEGKKLLSINFIISSMVTFTLLEIYYTSGILGALLVVGNLLILHYCFYLYRKLKSRNDGIKGLLKLTSDIVRYGDFRDKCKHMIINLKEIIPYMVCSVYTFDINSDSICYPVAYSAPPELDIGELYLNISDKGVTIRTIKEGKIYISKDIKKDKKVKLMGKLGEMLSSVVFVPLVVEEKVVGLILIGGDENLTGFVTKGIDDMLQILSNQMVLAIENDGIYRDMKNKADMDSLTKLYNRRTLDKEMEALIESNIPFSMVMYDIDDFKNVNDRYGHIAGDEVLKNIADIIKKSIRKTDVACRYGGEEIVIIFKDLKKEDAYIISERMRKNIEILPTRFGEADIFVTVSGGVSEFPSDGKTKEDIINIADEVLYSECKRKGKNKVRASTLINKFDVIMGHA